MYIRRLFLSSKCVWNWWYYNVAKHTKGNDLSNIVHTYVCTLNFEISIFTFHHLKYICLVKSVNPFVRRYVCRSIQKSHAIRKFQKSFKDASVVTKISVKVLLWPLRSFWHIVQSRGVDLKFYQIIKLCW